jgi:hypothetical protein
VTERLLDRRIQLLTGFALLGPPIAWVLQFVLGYGVTEAACGPAGSELKPPFHAWEVVTTAAAAVVAVTGAVAAVKAYRAVRDAEDDDPPPRGLVLFLSLVAMVSTPLFLAIILMSGIGALVLHECHQA